MNILLGGKPVKVDNAILGYLVLNAKKTPDLPFLSREEPRFQHLDGSANGTVACAASIRHQFFNPARAVTYNAFSSRGYEEVESLGHISKTLADLPIEKDLESPLSKELHGKLYPKLFSNTCLFVEHSKPFGMGVLLAKDLPVYMYGVFNQDQSLLVFTNIENFDTLLHKEHGDRHWIYRFAQRADLSVVLFTQRLCYRWYRWSQNTQLQSPGNRFAALERSLFKAN